MAKYITYNNIQFLHTQETYEVRKNQTGTIQYYTRTDTGESGMSLRGLANACGIADRSLSEFLDKTTIFEEMRGKTAKNESNSLSNNENEVRGTISVGLENEVVGKLNIYLIETDDLRVIRDIFCERVIYYYAFESKYKKTKARELYQALAQHGLRQFIHSKTGYQPAQAPNHDASTELSIEEQLKREVDELKLQLVKHKKQLVEKDEKIRQLEYHPIYEKTHQGYLQGLWGGMREFHVGGPYPGRIDLITDQMVVEVKRVTNFEYA